MAAQSGQVVSPNLRLKGTGTPGRRLGSNPMGLTAVAAALASSLWLAPSNAETRPRHGRSLRASLLGEPTTFDPQQAVTHADQTVAGLLFDSLYSLSPDGTALPELAAALPEKSADNRVWTIPIRVGAWFHNGKRLAVADVVASLSRLQNGPQSWLIASVASVEAAADQGAVILRLRYPDPRLLSQLASPVAAITLGGRRPNRRPIGTGPFRFDGLDRSGKEVRFRAFDKHHRGRAYLDRLLLRWYENFDDEARAYEVGRVQMSFRGQAAFAGHVPKYKTETVDAPISVLAYVGFGQSHPKLLADRDFRLALSLAINRESLARLGAGEQLLPTNRPVSAAVGGRPKSAAVRTQLKEAKQALARASSRVPALATPATLNLQILVNRSRPDDRDIADKILAATAKLGISATVATVGAAVWNKKVKRGATDLYIGQLAAPASSERIQLAAAFAAGGDSWASRALRRGPLDRASSYSEFRRRLPIVPLLHRSIRAHHRVDINGFFFDGSGQTEWANVFFFGAATRN